MFSEDEGATDDEHVYTAPILAEDEVLKGPSAANGPAVEPRRHSIYDDDIARPSSRTSSRPSSLYKVTSYEHQATPLEDLEEYEPLFPEDEQTTSKAAPEQTPVDPRLRPAHLHKQRFPSRDIWEDAPDSVHYTVEVSTPEVPEEQESKDESEPQPKAESHMPVPRDGETPAQAFARHQEELAEREAQKNGPDTFLKNSQKPSWVAHQPHLSTEKAGRPSYKHRFPSRDVWEDTPDSHMLETTVSTPQQDETESSIDASKPEVPERRPVRKATDPSSDKPAVPERPKKSASGDDKPSIPERPKPQVPARPAKANPTSGGKDAADAAAAPPKQKPAVPARPLGGKIAALQGNFLNDLNKKLGLGPQAPKKEEPSPSEEEKPAEEKAPLVDARKTRARGPQRRAPAAASSKSPSPAADDKPKFTLGFSVPATVFEVDPDEEEDDVKVVSVVEPEKSETKSAEPVVQDEGDKESSIVPSELPEAKRVGQEPVKIESVSEIRKPITDTETETQEEEKPEEKSEESSSVLDTVKAGIKSLIGGTASDEQAEQQKEDKEEDDEQQTPEEQGTKTLVNNSAGEPILTEQVKTDGEGKVEPVGVEQ